MAILKTNCPAIVYNNVAITEITKFSSESTPILDEMGNLTYVEHKISLEAFIDGSKELEKFLANPDFTSITGIPDYKEPDIRNHATGEVSHLIKLLLQAPRKTLHIVGSGWGDVHIFGEQPGSIDEKDLEEIRGNRSTSKDTA